MDHESDMSAIRPRCVIRTTKDLHQLLDAEIARLTAQPDLDPLKRARAMSEITRVMLLAIKQGTIEDRIAALEEELKWRRDNRKEKGSHE
jgi:hypothetical protein